MLKLPLMQIRGFKYHLGWSDYHYLEVFTLDFGSFFHLFKYNSVMLIPLVNASTTTHTKPEHLRPTPPTQGQPWKPWAASPHDIICIVHHQMIQTLCHQGLCVDICLWTVKFKTFACVHDPAERISELVPFRDDPRQPDPWALILAVTSSSSGSNLVNSF